MNPNLRQEDIAKIIIAAQLVADKALGPVNKQQLIAFRNIEYRINNGEYNIASINEIRALNTYIAPHTKPIRLIRNTESLPLKGMSNEHCYTIASLMHVWHKDMSVEQKLAILYGTEEPVCLTNHDEFWI